MIESWGVLLKTDCSLFLPGHGSADSRSLLQKDYDKRKLKISATSAHTVWGYEINE